MKTIRRDFKNIVDQLYADKVVNRLSNCKNIEETRSVWKNIVSTYKTKCRSWKDKHYFTMESEWVYPRTKRLKVSDHPIEICILIRLMNEEADGREVYNDEIVFEYDDLAARLKETELKAGQRFAEYIEEGEQICEIAENDFLRIFTD